MAGDILHRALHFLHCFVMIDVRMFSHNTFGNTKDPQSFISQAIKLITTANVIENALDIRPAGGFGDLDLFVGERP